MDDLGMRMCAYACEKECIHFLGRSFLVVRVCESGVCCLHPLKSVSERADNLF